MKNPIEGASRKILCRFFSGNVFAFFLAPVNLHLRCLRPRLILSLRHCDTVLAFGRFAVIGSTISILFNLDLCTFLIELKLYVAQGACFFVTMDFSFSFSFFSLNEVALIFLGRALVRTAVRVL